jgi:predicted O-methyltransferase YrrM
VHLRSGRAGSSRNGPRQVREEGFDPFEPSRRKWFARAALQMGRSPPEGIEKVKERFARGRERLVKRGQTPTYPADEQWEENLHRLLGVPWPCPAMADFPQIWSAVLETMDSRGLRVGRQSYGGEDDADPGLGRALWCLVRHLRPKQVVETGVAHGVSSRCILEGLERNGEGHLWSIDLPPLTIPERRPEIGAAVPKDRRGRWTYIEGSSRRRLPALLRERGVVDLFFHDSRHTTRNTRWELRQAWPVLMAGGAVVSDDLDGNWGFERFVEPTGDADAIHCRADDGERLFGVAVKQR